jgi:AcrR family transcriptional regulator
MAGMRAGRRPGASGTREAIAGVARRQFAELGYDRTSMRRIALEAGVDPTLVTHFYGSKQQLFLDVVELPFAPADVVTRLLSGDPASAGERVARFVLQVLESEQGRGRVIGIIRAATSEPVAARLIRDVLTRELLTPVAEAIGAGDARYRASLCASQMIGIALARYIVAIEPLASQPVDDVVAAVGPTLQRYLTGPLGAASSTQPRPLS